MTPEPARPTLLLVDDEERILSALRRSLRREGWDIVTAETAEMVATVATVAMEAMEAMEVGAAKVVLHRIVHHILLLSR